MSSRERYHHRKKAFGLMLLFALGAMGSPALAIDVELTLEQAKQVMASARGPMEQAASNDEMFAIIKAADKNSRIGDDPGRQTLWKQRDSTNENLLVRIFRTRRRPAVQGRATGSPDAGSQNPGNPEYAQP